MNSVIYNFFESKYFGFGVIILGVLMVKYMQKEDPDKYIKYT